MLCQLGPNAAVLTSRKQRFEVEFRGAGVKTTTASSKAPVSRSRKPRSKAQDDYGYAAGPSTVNTSRGGRSRAPTFPQENEENMRSLFVDDPDDPDFSDIEEITSPVPAARRPGTRAVPSASQGLTYNMDSDIEEIDSPVTRKVRLLETTEDLKLYESETVEMKCKEELTVLRSQV